MKVLVLGGNGFIGRHAVKQLKQSGVDVTIGSRNSTGSDRIPVKQLKLEELTNENDWKDITSQYDVVLNCVGILRQRPGEKYEDVHHLAPKAISCACADSNTRFVHVSALGLSLTAKSRFLTSKFKGEQAIKQSTCDWAIVRPSLLDGDGGFGAEWLRGVSKLPLFIIPSSATGKIAALTVEDAGIALARLCTQDAKTLNLEHSRIFELGGLKTYTFESYIRGLRSRYTNKRSVAIPIPGWIARAGAHLFDLVHFSPFSFGHWELLCSDNIPEENRLPELLGRTPTKVIE